MESLIKLQGLRDEVDPEEVLRKLYGFFNEIHTCSIFDRNKLLTIYSTADMLKSMGFPETSVAVIKRAVVAKIEALHEVAPAMMRETYVSLKQLENT